ncbi:hypothetical protein L2E82_25269 [Cichorium intybus]|uniref:Uncharacterized protein n=1 Tax=Cichorium intybus TaxID=13427 RepID=A0ACB9E3L3_CICIN|nr:hypothetical protein L2E82_25269 [Cichorium intybus]
MSGATELEINGVWPGNLGLDIGPILKTLDLVSLHHHSTAIIFLSPFCHWCGLLFASPPVPPPIFLSTRIIQEIDISFELHPLLSSTHQEIKETAYP